MEIIKKTIFQITTTGTTTGCTGNCYVIIPDTGVTYNIKILLTQDTDDIGFFDPYVLSGSSTGTTIHYMPYTVTGESTSRLNELKKYGVNLPFAQQYISGGTVIADGVVYPASVSGVSIVYWLGGIEYVDVFDDEISGTTFTFVGSGLTSPDFINKPIYKNPDKENIISNPKINDDVFIIRQELSAFDNNYRLEYIRSLTDLETYAGGNYFNIVKNT